VGPAFRDEEADRSHEEEDESEPRGGAERTVVVPGPVIVRVHDRLHGCRGSRARVTDSQCFVRSPDRPGGIPLSPVRARMASIASGTTIA
jgi:hypothetical protein